MTENLRSRDSEKLVLPPFSSSKEKTSGFSVPFVFQQLQDGKPCTCCLCLSNLLNLKHFGHAGVVRGTKTWNYFISSVRKYFTAKIQSKENKFSYFTLCAAEGYGLVNGFQSQCLCTSTVLCSEEKTTQWQHDAGMSLWHF